MSALIFLFSFAVIAGAMLATDAGGYPGFELPRRRLSLNCGLCGGNWPAKIGDRVLVVRRSPYARARKPSLGSLSDCGQTAV
jgi:hypothetical protein